MPSRTSRAKRNVSRAMPTALRRLSLGLTPGERVTPGETVTPEDSVVLGDRVAETRRPTAETRRYPMIPVTAPAVSQNPLRITFQTSWWVARPGSSSRLTTRPGSVRGADRRRAHAAPPPTANPATPPPRAAAP